MKIDKIDIPNTNYRNAFDIGVGSKGILRLCVFTSNIKDKQSKFSHYEYYLVQVKDDFYNRKTDFHTYLTTTHKFTLEILDVLQGKTKKIGDTLVKRGKSLYCNYHELETASVEKLADKHNRRILLKI